jgi:hypothetical protein
VLECLGTCDINVEYLYCFPRSDGKTAVDIVRVSDPERADGCLAAGGFTLVHASEIYEPDPV